VAETSSAGAAAAAAVEMEKKGDNEKCAHRYRVTDEITAEEVCPECGLVLDRLLGDRNEHSQSYEDDFDTVTDDALVVFRRNQAFLDVCDSMMMNEGVAKRAEIEYNKFTRLCADQQKEVVNGAKGSKKHCTGVLRDEAMGSKTGSVPQNELAAYSLYIANLKEGAGRSPDEIAAYTGVDRSSLCQLEEIFPPPLELQRNISCLPRFCYDLGITYKQQLEITDIYNRVTNADGHRPVTVVAAIIYLYMKRIGGNNTPPDVRKGRKADSGRAGKGAGRITIKRVADVCNVSKLSLSKLAKSIKNDLCI
jgi:transcription initiation factor TFIIIB Brf1 subunit/transcription initiation factor TFIIB